MSDPTAGDVAAGIPGEGTGGPLHLRRWTMTTGSGSERATGSRAAVVLAAGDSQWEGTAESAGAIGETAAADALVELVIEPPSRRPMRRRRAGNGAPRGTHRHTRPRG